MEIAYEYQKDTIKIALFEQRIRYVEK